MKLVEKTLSLSSSERNNIRDSEIYHLENVDLKHVSAMTSSLHLTVEIPFTITVAIILLFTLNFSLGFITIFWFIIIFLLQGVLARKMGHCNLTKHELIHQRSKFNYEFMEKVSKARVVHA